MRQKKDECCQIKSDRSERKLMRWNFRLSHTKANHLKMIIPHKSLTNQPLNKPAAATRTPLVSLHESNYKVCLRSPYQLLFSNIIYIYPHHHDHHEYNFKATSQNLKSAKRSFQWMHQPPSLRRDTPQRTAVKPSTPCLPPTRRCWVPIMLLAISEYINYFVYHVSIDTWSCSSNFSPGKVESVC